MDVILHVSVETEPARPNRVHREAFQVRVDIEGLIVARCFVHFMHQRTERPMDQRSHLFEFSRGERWIDHEPLSASNEDPWH